MLRAFKTWRFQARAPRTSSVDDHQQPGTLPSWLASLAVHMLVIILLGLWLRAELAPEHGVALDVTLQDAGEGPVLEATSSGALDAELQFESWADAHEPEAAESTPQLSDDLIEPIEAVDLALAPKLSGVFGAGTNAGTGDSGDGGGPGGGAGLVRTSLFGVAGEGRTFVYVCDCSGSMNFIVANPESLSEYVRVPFMAARAELLSSINELGNKNEFGLIFYNHKQFPFDPAEVYPGESGGRRRKPRNWDQRVFPATSENKGLAKIFITEFRADGETDHMMALDLALRMRPDVIFMLTDAEAKDDPSARQVLSLTRFNRRRTTINIVQFAPSPRPESTMIELAERNGGKHVFCNIADVGKPVAP